VLFYYLKNVFEAADTGVMEFRQADAAYIVLRNQRTAGDKVLKLIEERSQRFSIPAAGGKFKQRREDCNLVRKLVLLVACFAIVHLGFGQVPLPMITSTVPVSTALQPATGPGITLHVYGTGFQPGAVVVWNGTHLTTTMASPTELVGTVAATRLVTPKTAIVSVADPGNVLSINTVAFPVTVATKPPGAVNWQTAGNSPVSSPCTPEGLTVADFNGDGIRDMLCGISAPPVNGLFLYPGRADGSFGAPVLLDSDPVFWQVVSDFNRDGFRDILFYDGPGSVLLLGNGGGTFRPAINVPLTVQPAPSIGDFNGDGKLDLASVICTGSPATCNISVLLGEGNGTFQPPVLTPVSTAGGFSGMIISPAGDWNGDGIPDLILVSPTAVTLYTGTGVGTFTAGASVLWPTRSMGPWLAQGAASITTEIWMLRSPSSRAETIGWCRCSGTATGLSRLRSSRPLGLRHSSPSSFST
jgi:hypothetical protein